MWRIGQQGEKVISHFTVSSVVIVGQFGVLIGLKQGFI